MNITGFVSQELIYVIAATNSPTSFGIMGGVFPGWMTFDPDTGTVGGYPDSEGSYTFTISATNGDGTDSKTLTLDVEAVMPIPYINMFTTALIIEDVPFSLQIYATNSPTSYAVDDLPDGLSVNISTGLITGTPTTGVMNMTVKATNSAGTGTRVITNQILDGIPPTAPFNVTATSIMATQFMLMWSLGISDVPLSAVEVWKDGILHQTLGAGSAGQLQQLLVSGVTYLWKVRTKDVEGLYSDFSEEITVTQI